MVLVVKESETSVIWAGEVVVSVGCVSVAGVVGVWCVVFAVLTSQPISRLAGCSCLLLLPDSYSAQSLLRPYCGRCVVGGM